MVFQLLGCVFAPLLWGLVLLGFFTGKFAGNKRTAHKAVIIVPATIEGVVTKIVVIKVVVVVAAFQFVIKSINPTYEHIVAAATVKFIIVVAAVKKVVAAATSHEGREPRPQSCWRGADPAPHFVVAGAPVKRVVVAATVKEVLA